MKRPSTDCFNKRFIRNNKGQIVLVLAVTGLFLVVASGLGIDAANLTLRRAELRRAADAGAMAGLFALPNASAGGSFDTAILNARQVAWHLDNIVDHFELSSVSRMHPPRPSATNCLAWL